VAYIAEREGGERRWPTGELKFLKGAVGNQRGCKGGGAQPSETRIRMTNLNPGYKAQWVGELREAVVIWNARRSNHLNAKQAFGHCHFSFLFCAFPSKPKSPFIIDKMKSISLVLLLIAGKFLRLSTSTKTGCILLRLLDVSKLFVSKHFHQHCCFIGTRSFLLICQAHHVDSAK